MRYLRSPLQTSDAFVRPRRLVVEDVDHCGHCTRARGSHAVRGRRPARGGPTAAGVRRSPEPDRAPSASMWSICTRGGAPGNVGPDGQRREPGQPGRGAAAPCSGRPSARAGRAGPRQRRASAGAAVGRSSGRRKDRWVRDHVERAVRRSRPRHHGDPGLVAHHAGDRRPSPRCGTRTGARRQPDRPPPSDRVAAEQGDAVRRESAAPRTRSPAATGAGRPGQGGDEAVVDGAHRASAASAARSAPCERGCAAVHLLQGQHVRVEGPRPRR